MPVLMSWLVKIFAKLLFNNAVHKTVQGHMKRTIASLLTSAITLFL